MTIKIAGTEVSYQLAQALTGDDQAAIANAFQAFGNDIADQIRQDYEDMEDARDAAALQARGYRQLTGAETTWYQKLATALKQPKDVAKQKFIDIINSDDVEDIMPETIIEDVMRYIAEAHPLLNAVRMQYVGYTTKWIINDNTVQRGSWGPVESAVTAEIQGALKVLDITQAKYSAFAVIPLDLLEMGPTYLDAFIRATLGEALAIGYEDAIINGTGKDMPIGLTRNPNSAFDPGTGYVEKQAVETNSFLPAAYGKLLAKLAKTEKGRTRTFGKVTMIVNTVDYLTKIMPATTVLTANGVYVNNLFPFPTDVIQSSVLSEGKAVVSILDEYNFLVGGTRRGMIEYSDEFKFLDDVRTFKFVTHATGRAYDNTSAIVLDISKLEPAYVVVQNTKNPADPAAQIRSATISEISVAKKG